ncbi:MAG: sterol desaturase family protein [Pseudomonadota bacterium]
MDIFGSSEPVLRFSVFAGVLLAMAALEVLIPKRELRAPRSRRWLTNFAIVGIDSALVRLMSALPGILGAAAVPLVAVAAAITAEELGWGLLQWIAAPYWLALIVSILVLDFAIWFQHYVSHKVPILWRLHQVHHADVDIDVSTAIRFHPIEILLSMLYKVVIVLLLGAPAVAVVLFEVILNGCAMFNHANINLPPWLDRFLRLFLVTPDMHRVHHSVLPREHDTNFGFNLSIWDRLFGTYTAQPEGGHLGMTIGLQNYQNDNPTRLSWSLVLPFASRPDAKPVAPPNETRENVSETRRVQNPA